MADGIKISVEGSDELVKALSAMHDEAIVLAGMEAAKAGSLRMRTRLRRAAPVGRNSKTRIKAGWPRLGEVMRAFSGSSAPVAWAGMISRSPFYYRVLDVGRRAFKRNGRPVAGSGPMHPWWDRAVSSASGEVTDVMQRKLIEQLRKRIPAIIAKYGAPLKFR